MDTIVTPDLFGDADITSVARMRQRVNRQKDLLLKMKRSGQRLPLQYSLQMRQRKNMRKNKFSLRSSVLRNEEGNNTERWSDLGILQVHIALLEDFLQHFENGAFVYLPIKDQYDYWTWIERDDGDFSLYDCLAVSGFRNPDSFIEGIRARRPDWMQLLEVLEPRRRYAVLSRIRRRTTERATDQVA